MSLAGKILTVLVTLVLLAWLYLFASVAQLNRSWGLAIENQKKTFEQQTGELEDLQAKSFAASQSLLRERAITDDAEASLRRAIDDFQARLAAEREALSRLQLHIESEKSLSATSQAAVARRTQERAKLQEDLAALQTEIAVLEQREAELMEEVTSLLTRFQALVAQNQELVRQRTGAATAPATSAVPTPSIVR